MAEIIENFKNLKENYGQKGNNLKILMEVFSNKKKVIVPETLILPISIYKKIVSENGNTDFSDYKNIYINPNLEKKILGCIHSKFGNEKLVIRSSATCEDSIFFSGSGQYDSFLNVNSDEKIIEAIKKIYASLYGKNSKLYTKIYNINLNKENMAILIQAVAPVIKAGVMFSCNPIDMKRTYIIESTKGLGTNVVEGVGNINHLEIDYKTVSKVDDKEIKMLINTINIIKKRFKYDVDIEWGIDKNNNLYIFQVRPIIYKNTKFNINYDKSLVLKKCIPISRGFSIGKIENITAKEKSSILYQNKKYDFNDLEVLLTSKGVILKENSKLSHFANILRELVKPCVYVENFKFEHDNLYAIDAFNGNIIDFSKLNGKDKVELMLNSFNYMKTILNDSFEKYNGILSIDNDDKIEEVVFDINKKKVIDNLIKNGYKKKIVRQGIYTYDFKDNSLINDNTIFRIQISNKKINIQFKQLDTAHKNYRKEKGIIIKFDSLKNAKEFMKSYLMIETGYQERKITKYEKEDVSVNVITWPDRESYLGIESKSLERLKKVNDELELNDCLITGWGGKQIFERLNLTLNDCQFNEGRKK